MNLREAIKNLEVISDHLDNEANKKKNYNSDWGYYLEQMSWQMYQQANELRVLEYTYGITQQKSTD